MLICFKVGGPLGAVAGEIFFFRILSAIRKFGTGAAIGGYAANSLANFVGDDPLAIAYEFEMSKRYVRDEERDACVNCTIEFSSIVRRHHCVRHKIETN
jgi:hypothetical protein